MAKAIFRLNSENEPNSLYRIARDENFLNSNKNFDNSNYTILDITEDQFNDIKLNEIMVLSHNGSTIVTQRVDGSDSTDSDTPPNAPAEYVYFGNENDLKAYINVQINELTAYSENNSSHPISTLIDTYVEWLRNLDTSSVPLNISLEKYASQQGQEPISILELI